MCNCNSAANACSTGYPYAANACVTATNAASQYVYYNCTWQQIEQAARTAECAAFNANKAASQAAEYSATATAARDQVNCLIAQYNNNRNQCECCCCNCCSCEL